MLLSTCIIKCYQKPFSPTLCCKVSCISLSKEAFDSKIVLILNDCYKKVDLYAATLSMTMTSQTFTQGVSLVCLGNDATHDIYWFFIRN